MEQLPLGQPRSLGAADCTDDVFEKLQGLAPKNLEEKYVKVLARNPKNSDSVYLCPHCNLEFHGGRQKIRGHFQVGDCGGPAYRQRSCTSVPQKVLMHFSEGLEKAGKYFTTTGKRGSEEDLALGAVSAKKVAKSGMMKAEIPVPTEAQIA
jgi:hypothetical protein